MHVEMMKWLGVAAVVVSLQAAKALDAGCTVTLFEGDNLDGTSAAYTLGEYAVAALTAGGITDNAVSSLTVVGPRCMATLYNGENLEGGQWNANYPEGTYPLTQLQLRGGYTDQTSSLKVWRTSCAVTLFENDNFDTSAFYITLTAHSYTLADITSFSGGSGDNIVTSIRVAGPRCSAIAYEGSTPGSGAWSASLPSGDYDLAALQARGAFDDQLSSVTVEVAGCVVTIYDGSNLEDNQWYLPLLPGDYPLTTLSAYGGGTAANVVSSLRVSGYGCTATLYQTNNLDAGGGWSATFSEGDYPSAEFVAGGATDNQMNSISIAYTASVFTLTSDVFTGNSGAASIQTFFPASIGEQWTYDGTGLTLAEGAGAHNQAILRSVAFTLPKSTSITVVTSVGDPGSITTAATQGAVVEGAGAAGASGFLGVAINDYDTNTYLVSQRRSTSSTTSESIVLSMSDLSLYQNKKVTVDIVDTFTGTNGYLSVTSITIAVACAELITLDTCQYDVTGCTAVPPGTACSVYCQGPYAGTATTPSCPAGNLDDTTPLTNGNLPTCTLPCLNNPVPLPTGYTGVDPAISCDTANGYTGTALRQCTMDGTCTIQISVSGCSLPGVGSLSGDPVTYYGTQRSEFKIPIGDELTPLLEVPDMRVLARAKRGHEAEEQWIDRIIVLTAKGQEVVCVTIKDGLFDFNRSDVLPNAFETISVKMGWWFSKPLEIMPPADEYYTHWDGLRLAFGRARGPLTDAPRRELVMVVSQFATVYITSSSANEYHEQPFLAYKYAHLDLLVGEMRNRTSFRGLLPEVWGIAPPGRWTRHGWAEVL